LKRSRLVGIASCIAVSGLLLLAGTVPASAKPIGPPAPAPAPAKTGHSTSGGPATLGVYSPGKAAEYGKTPRSLVPQGDGYFAAGRVQASPGTTPQVATSSSSYYVGTNFGATGRCGFALCLYWDGNEGGAAIGFNSQVANYYGYVFPYNGTGGGTAVKNNAASAEDQGNVEAGTYYNENYQGNEDWMNPQSYGNLYLTWNDEASGGPWF